MLTNLRNQKGFTLIELMIVVAIIGILSAIAIPNFITFRYKAKTSEAKSNLGAIRSCEEAYKAEMESYLVCTASPASSPASAAQTTWADQGGFTDIGFAPSGKVYYVYSVAGNSAIASTFIATAAGNLDGTGSNGTFTITNDSTQVVNADPNAY